MTGAWSRRQRGHAGNAICSGPTHTEASANRPFSDGKEGLQDTAEDNFCHGLDLKGTPQSHTCSEGFGKTTGLW